MLNYARAAFILAAFSPMFSPFSPAVSFAQSAPSTVSAPSAATSPASANTKHPCEQIKEACEAAGFVKNEAKGGKGLWVDCIDPIIQGKAQPAKAVIKLPTVDPSLVSQCKAKRSNFGEGKKAK